VEVGSLILMYHDLQRAGAGAAPAERRPYVLEVERFGRQLRMLRSASLETRRVRDWRGRPVAPGGAAPPSRGVMITFDDGDRSNHAHALPLLQEAGMVATFFVTVGRVGDQDTLDWGQVVALSRSGMEVGSHTMTHRAPITLRDDELRDELVESKKRLEDHIGAEVVSLSCPTGLLHPRMGALAREAGYAVLCTSRIGLVDESSDPYRLPRIAVKEGMDDTGFRRLLDGDPSLLFRLRAGQAVRDGLKKVLGPRRYVRWRRRVLELRARR
jgi:peptidoglycan/xylan/chitin deacetylase (PgdA/CDA1 family)